MDDFKYNIESDNLSSNNFGENIPNILDICDINYDDSEDILSFYEKFRRTISLNLKKTGYKLGDAYLLQDEIISSTFEEVIILWCLDKINSNLSPKIKSNFHEKLNTGVSINEFKSEIFNFFSSKQFSEEIKSKAIKCKTCSRQIVTKTDPEVLETSDVLPSTENIEDTTICIKQEDIENIFLTGDDYDNRDIVKREKIKDYSDEENSMDMDEFHKNGKLETKSGSMSDNDYSENGEDDELNEDWMPDNDILKDQELDHKKPMKRNRNGPPAKNSTPIKCDLCDRVCAGERRLQEHIDRKHNKIFKCRKCGETFQDWDGLKKHTKTAHKANPIKPPQVVCDTCGKSVAGKRRLQEHIQRKHNSIFSCKHCDQIFKSNEELKAHKLKSHKPAIKPQMCPHCGKIIKSYGMKRHILTHISDITCKICREKFLTQEELDVHTKRHEENPNYRILKKRNIQCDTCKRAFANAEEYGLHMCKHYGCELCEESFMTKRNLEIHKKYHAGEQIFSCDLCEALFVNRKALYCHKRAAHDPDKKKYKCDECGKAFLNPCHLERHKNTHVSDKPHKCEVCLKGFKQKSGLKNHMHSHTGELPFPCVSCDQRFRTSIKMKQHRESGKCGMKMEDVPTKVES